MLEMADGMTAVGFEAAFEAVAPWPFFEKTGQRM